MTFKIIVAADDKRGVGKEGGIPWSNSQDMAHFKKLTTGGIVIMGRKTWESIRVRSRPLKNRTNMVLTRQLDYGGAVPVHVWGSITEMVKVCSQLAQDRWIIGGASLYAQFLALDLVSEIHYTHIHGDWGCDVHFPEVDLSWRKWEAQEVQAMTPAPSDGKLGALGRYTRYVKRS